MSTFTEGLLTLEEAARLLGVSKITLRRWTRSGSLGCVRVGQRGDRRFRREDLEFYVAARIRSGSVGDVPSIVREGVGEAPALARSGVVGDMPSASIGMMGAGRE
jgi:excisionase family DNA binding protein